MTARYDRECIEGSRFYSRAEARMLLVRGGALRESVVIYL